MVFVNEIVEIVFYLGITLIIELLVLLGLRYFNKKFIVGLILINLITNPIYSSLLAIYSHLLDNEMGIVLILVIEVIIVFVEFKFLSKYLNDKYSKMEILFTVILVNGFSFLLIEFIKYALEHYPIFPIF